jgi:hypothetical protein
VLSTVGLTVATVLLRRTIMRCVSLWSAWNSCPRERSGVWNLQRASDGEEVFGVHSGTTKGRDVDEGW